MSNVPRDPEALLPPVPNIYRGPFTPNDVAVPAPGSVLSNAQVEAARTQLVIDMRAIEGTNARLNTRMNRATRLNRIMSGLHGAGSQEAQLMAYDSSGRVAYTAGELTGAQNDLVNTFLDSDPDQLVDLVRFTTDQHRDRHAGNLDAFVDAQMRYNATDNALTAHKGSPISQAALGYFDDADAVRSGRRNLYPSTKLPSIPFGNVLSFTGLYFSDKGTPSRTNVPIKSIGEIMAHRRYLRAENPAQYTAAAYADGMKGQGAAYNKAIDDHRAAGDALRRAAVQELRTSGVAEAIWRPIEAQVLRRESIRTDYNRIGQELKRYFGASPLGQVPTEAITRAAEASLAELDAHINSLRPTDPLRHELFGTKIRAAVRLHQRVAMTTNPTTVTTQSNFAPGRSRAVIVNTGTRQMHLHEDGSIEPTPGNRRTLRNEAWVAPTAKPDVATPVYGADESDVTSPRYRTDQQLLDDATDAIAEWDLVKGIDQSDERVPTHTTEQIAANTAREVSERIANSYALRKTEYQDLRTRTAGAQALLAGTPPTDPEYATRSADLLTLIRERDSKFTEMKGTRSQLNTMTYWQLFLSMTSPNAAGITNPTARMTGDGGTIAVDGFELNGIVGNWTINWDGTSTLNAGGRVQPYGRDGIAI